MWLHPGPGASRNLQRILAWEIIGIRTPPGEWNSRARVRCE
jgi:hypothetical protein